MARGFLPVHTLNERVELLTTQPQRLPELVAEASARVNDFLATATALVRGRFEGKITYGENPKPPQRQWVVLPRSLSTTPRPAGVASDRRMQTSRLPGDQDWMKANRSALIVSAWVVGMPCGNAEYVFKVPFCTSFADSGPESA